MMNSITATVFETTDDCLYTRYLQTLFYKLVPAECFFLTG